MKNALYLFLVFVLSFALVACSGDVDISADEQQQEQTDNLIEEPEETELPEDEETPEEVEDVEEVDQAAYEEFRRILQETPEYHVEYDIIDSSDGEERVAIYAKDDKTRMDVYSGDEFTLWMNGESVVEFEGQCLDLSATENFGFNPEQFYNEVTVEGSVKSEDEYFSVSSIGTEIIAGKTTECFEFIYRTDTTNQVTKYCLTQEGIPALIKSVDGETGELYSEVRANTIETSVSDDVLEPCEPNVDISGLI